MLTGPCSISHAVLLPSAFVTVTNTHECGLVQRNSVDDAGKRHRACSRRRSRTNDGRARRRGAMAEMDAAIMAAPLMGSSFMDSLRGVAESLGVLLLHRRKAFIGVRQAGAFDRKSMRSWRRKVFVTTQSPSQFSGSVIVYSIDSRSPLSMLLNPLDDSELLAERHEPVDIVLMCFEIARVDDERLAFPVTDRLAVVARHVHVRVRMLCVRRCRSSASGSRS